jgi:hypothetical protein
VILPPAGTARNLFLAEPPGAAGTHPSGGRTPPDHAKKVLTGTYAGVILRKATRLEEHSPLSMRWINPNIPGTYPFVFPGPCVSRASGRPERGRPGAGPSNKENRDG